MKNFTLLMIFISLISCKSAGTKMLESYKKTGDSNGQMVGQNRDYKVGKRSNCKEKKKKFRKEGVNGQKEMTEGM